MTAGTILVGIGILGIFLPLLPTTVFFLMAAWCYARSSEKFYRWLHHNKYFGKYIKDYREGRGITLSSKISTILILWASITYSIVFAVEIFFVKILLFLIAVGVTIHILTIPTNRMKE
ncbi:MAG: YbaN family protein [Bacteroidetes bacterium]|nr:YbaN family protein [Bacteroidota bacterium]